VASEATLQEAVTQVAAAAAEVTTVMVSEAALREAAQVAVAAAMTMVS
jgi:hypothetical protein